MTDFAVELHSITKTFGSFTAVNEVSLTVRNGEFLTLLGPSGCGKTTLLRMIAGFEYPDAGRVLLSGADVTRLPPYRRPVHTVFQHYALFPHMTVERNVAFGLEQKRLPKPEIRRKIKQALDMVQLEGFEDRLPGQLSGGQQQRVAIARALVCEPQVLLLDEPLGALDLKLRKEMQVELKMLQKRLGIGFLFVTHDQEEALTMSDRIAVLSKGRIDQLGTPEEIYERPRTQFVAGFIGTSNLLRGTVGARNGRRIEVEIAGNTVPVLSPNPPDIGAPAVVAVRPEKIKLEAERTSDSLLSGTVEEHLYLGAGIHWRVLLSDGQPLTVLESNDGRGADRSKYRAGQSVFLHWPTDDGILLES